MIRHSMGFGFCGLQKNNHRWGINFHVKNEIDQSSHRGERESEIDSIFANVVMSSYLINSY